MNEWGFAGEIKSVWDAVVAENPILKLGQVRIEESPEGDSCRADLTLRGHTDVPLLVLELRLPDHVHPDPLDIGNITNAMNKAVQLGARWSATSDGRTVYLLDHRDSAKPLRNRAVPVEPLATPATRAALSVPASLTKIKAAWAALLRTLGPVLTGQTQAPAVAPDEFFAESLRASLTRPFTATRDAMLDRNAKEPSFGPSLVRWMVDEQGWQHDAARFEEEIAHIAQVATYVFATRLLFYGALRRAQHDTSRLLLTPLSFPTPPTSTVCHAVVEALFGEARVRTGDYETVFRADDITDWALISDRSCQGWAEIIELLDHFKLEELSYDVLGRLFERLIDPHERYEWGQHYTSPDVVDLMLSATMPEGVGTVADFACGGGTFLVRAYARKRAYEPGANHNDRLGEIFGGDISAFAASVSTISLAAQFLASGANYPQIRVGSFFTTDPARPFVRLPDPRTVSPQDRMVPPLDAVVCNPPYIAYQHMGAARQTEAEYAFQRDQGGNRTLKHRWNYHLPFWWHSARYLRDGGRMAFITSGEWLDSDYGEQLKSWLTSNFHLHLIIESMSEQWFTEARVGTVVVVAEKLPRGTSKERLTTRLVALRRPLRDLYGESPEDDTLRLLAVDAFRDRLLALTGRGQSDDFDHETVTQTGLSATAPWRSRLIRSPQAARILDERDDYVSVGEVGEVSLGLKTGADNFFLLDNLGPGSAGKVKVRGFHGWQGEMPRKHLRPALRRPSDLDHSDKDGRWFRVTPKRVKSFYFAPIPARTLPVDVRAYITEGEIGRVNVGRLVSDNAGTEWFRQGRALVTPDWALPYNSAYDYFAIDNTENRAVINGRFVGVTANEDVDTNMLGAILNSTFSLLARLLVGVPTGNEGALDVGPPALRAMRIPDPRRFTVDGAEAVRNALEAIRKADTIPAAPDLNGHVTQERRNLDMAVTAALGMGKGDAAVLLDNIYIGYARWRNSVRDVELELREHRRRLTARGGHRGQDPLEAAARSILDQIAPDIRVDFNYSLNDTVAAEWLDARRPTTLAHQDALLDQTTVVLADGVRLDLGSGARVDLVTELRDMGITGALPIPFSPENCRTLAHEIARQRLNLRSIVAPLAVRAAGETHAGQVTSRVERLWESRQVAAIANTIKRPEPTHEPNEPSLLHPDGLVPPLPSL